MPAKSKRGETPVEELFGASREMFDSMTEDELEEMAHTKHATLPEPKKPSEGN
jgi:Protein of unknwon function (DUF3008)